MNTPYLLQERAGLSTGATIPALRRLLQKKDIIRGKRGERGRGELHVTENGLARLDEEWELLFKAEPPKEVEQVLRIACLAALRGAPRPTIGRYLRSAAQAGLPSAPHLRANTPIWSAEDEKLFAAMKEFVDNSRRQSTNRALSQLASLLSERPRNLRQERVKGC